MMTTIDNPNLSYNALIENNEDMRINFKDDVVKSENFISFDLQNHFALKEVNIKSHLLSQKHYVNEFLALENGFVVPFNGFRTQKIDKYSKVEFEMLLAKVNVDLSNIDFSSINRPTDSAVVINDGGVFSVQEDGTFMPQNQASMKEGVTQYPERTSIDIDIHPTYINAIFELTFEQILEIFDGLL